MVGYNAAVIALGMGAQVTILERSVDRMRHLEEILSGRVPLLMSSTLQIEESLKDADLVDRRRPHPRRARPEARHARDARVDEGGLGASSTSRSTRAAAPRPRSATTHDEPVYTVEGVIHYCVANMPGAVPITSTRALTNVTLPYVEADRRSRRRRGDHGESGAREGRQRRRRQADLRGGGRGARARVHAARRRALAGAA